MSWRPLCWNRTSVSEITTKRIYRPITSHASVTGLFWQRLGADNNEKSRGRGDTRCQRVVVDNHTLSCTIQWTSIYLLESHSLSHRLRNHLYHTLNVDRSARSKKISFDWHGKRVLCVFSLPTGHLPGSLPLCMPMETNHVPLK